MYYGRDNISATIHVPFGCKQNCSFCTVKKLYKEYKPSQNGVLEAALYVAELKIPEVVISGGEPFDNIPFLHALMFALRDKTVYINTCMPNVDFAEVKSFVSMHKNLGGINISRHTHDETAEELKDIANDNYIKELAKIVSVRINCVIDSGCADGEYDTAPIIQRWNYHKVSVNFREDYTITEERKLHSLYGVPYDLLVYPLESESRCAVCQTFRFNATGKPVTFHKGLKNTRRGEEINDIIVYPNGDIALDWDAKPITEAEKNKLLAVSTKKTETKKKPKMTQTTPMATGSSCGSGSPSCGGTVRRTASSCVTGHSTCGGYRSCGMSGC